MAASRSVVEWGGSTVRVVLMVLAMASVQHYRDDVHPANEASRVYAALALVDHGTVALDPVFDDFFPGWRTAGHPPNVDVSRVDGSFRLDKAPGLTLFAVPILGLLRAAGFHPSFATLTWLLAVLLSALPSALFAEALRHRLRRDGRAGGDLVAVGTVLATPWLIYGGLLFGHALAASLAGGGLLLVLGPTRPNGDDGGRRSAAIGGLLLGLAVLTEYPVAALAILGSGAMAVDRSRRRLLPWVMLGALGPACGLLAWNDACFGSPFAVSYGYKAASNLAAVHAQGAFGFTLPSAERLAGILIGPRRGLLFLAPWMLAGLAGSLMAASNRGFTAAWRVALGAGVPAWCLLVSGFVDWTAGASVGPRHLLPGLPLMAVGSMVLLQASPASAGRRIALAAAAGPILSAFALSAAAAWTFPYAIESIVNPVAELAIPVLLEAGPAPTVWDGLLPRPLGALLALAAGLVLLGLPLGRFLGIGQACQVRTGAIEGVPSPAGTLAPGRLLAAAFVTAVLHLAGATLPETSPEHTASLLRNRAWAFEMLGRDDLATAVRDGINRAREH